MARTPQYQKLLNKLKTGELNKVEREILEAFQKVCSSRANPDYLFCETGRNLSNDLNDWKFRKGIESLHNCLILIVSSLGEAGYCWDQLGCD